MGWPRTDSDAACPAQISAQGRVCKSYQRYRTVCYRQSGNLVRFGETAHPPPGGGLGGNSRASGVGRLNGLPKGSAGVPRGSLAGQRARFGPLPRASRAGDPGGDPLGIPGGSKGAPRGSAWVLGGSGLLETPKRRGFRGDPVGPLYHCIILIKGTHDFRARGGEGRRASRILLCRSF